MTPKLQENIRKYALINAVKHKGKAETKRVLSKILSEEPQLRDKASLLINIIDNINNIICNCLESSFLKCSVELIQKKCSR